MEEKTNSPQEVGASKTTLEIIIALNELGEGSLREISEYLDKSPSTVYRHLNTLLNEEFIIKNSKTYYLGTQFLTLGGAVQGNKPYYDLAKSKVDELAEQTNERSQFVVEEYGYRIYLHTATGDQAVRTDSRIGKRGPIHCSAAGKAILAELSDERVKEIVKDHGLSPETSNTITDCGSLTEELNKIRKESVAFNYQESTQGLHAVGTSVTKPSGEVIGALSVSGPAHRLTEDRMESEVADLILGVANELELKIEYNL